MFKHKFLTRILLCVIAGCLSISVAAAAGPTVSETVNVAWTAPTTNTDGSAISGTLAYNVYGAASASATTWTKVVSGATASPSSFTAPAGDTCFAVTAVETEGGSPVESAPSAPACLLIPNAPGSIKVTVTVTVQ